MANNGLIASITGAEIEAGSNKIEIPASYINSCQIFESITLAGTIGDITIFDFAQIFEQSNIIPGDKITIYVAVQDTLNNKTEPQQVIYKFVIYSINHASAQNSENYNALGFKFASSWLVNALQTQVSKFYKNQSITQIVQDLVQTSNTDGYYSIGSFEPSKYTLDEFFTPYWTPLHSILYLSKYNQSNNGDYSYLIYTDEENKKINYQPISKIISNNNGIPETLTLESQNFLDFSRIVEFRMKNLDIIQYIQSGSFAKNLVAFNYYSGNIVQNKTTNIQQYKSKLGTKGIPVNSNIFQNNISGYFPAMLLSGSNPVNDNDFQNYIDSFINTQFSNSLNDIVKLNISTYPNKRKIGDIVNIKLYGAGINRSDTHQYIDNKTLNGSYIIRDILHTFYKKSYSQNLVVIADGYYDFPSKRTDIIQWGKQS